MEKKQKISIHFRGGILSPGFLMEVLLLAKEARVHEVSFGLRQQLLLEMDAKRYAGFAASCRKQGITHYLNGAAAQNIVSSYFTDGIFDQDSWLKEGTYKDILDQFNYTPRLKINICNQKQRFVLFYTGNLNWISSENAQFWHLFIRFPHSRQLYCWPELIYTNDIRAVSEFLEQLIYQHGERFMDPAELKGQDLYDAFKARLQFSYISKSIASPIQLPGFALPYYEGFNKYSGGYWLGIYRREESFAVNFLIDLCDNCISNSVGELYTTTWKSLIIKGIEPGKRHLWDFILGKYRINVRHAANELNWQIEESQEAMVLKRHIIRYFDKEDVRTFGLCFGIQTKTAAHMFASIVIRGCARSDGNKLKYLEYYDILYQSEFNPNHAAFTLFRQRVARGHIGTYLVSLCKLFYEQQSNKHLPNESKLETSSPIPSTPPENKIYQCPHCLTVYDETVGDPEQAVAAGTRYAALPNNYVCPVCSAGHSEFVQIASILTI